MSRRWWLALVGVLVCALCAVALLSVLSGQSLDRSVAVQFIGTINQSQMNPRVPLPPTLRRGVADPCVYVTRAPTSNAYLFISWRGKGRNMHGLLYLTNGATPPGNVISLQYPDYGPTGPMQRVEARLSSSQGTGWYEVMYDQD